MDDVDRVNDWVTLKSLRYGKAWDIFVDGRVARWVICAFTSLRAAADNCLDASISRSTHLTEWGFGRRCDRDEFRPSDSNSGHRRWSLADAAFG